MIDKNYLSSNETALLIGVGPSSVKRWADQGLIPCSKTAGGHRRFLLSDVLNFKAARIGHPEPSSFLPLPSIDIETTVDLLIQRDHHQIRAHLLDLRSSLGSWFKVADFLGAVVEKIGVLWEEGEITVAMEHRASDKLLRSLHSIGDTLPATPNAKRCLLSCVEGDYHSIGLALAEVCLRECHWNPLWIGSNTPLEDVLSSMDEELSMVAISASQCNQSPLELERYARAVSEQAKSKNIAVVFGGKGSWPVRSDYGHLIQSFEAFNQYLQTFQRKGHHPTV